MTGGSRRELRAAPKSRENLLGYLFASPWFIGFFALTLGPMVVSFLFAFIKWDGINLEDIKWVGTANYARAAADPDVRKALVNTAYYSFLSVPLGLAAALGLAMLLNQQLRGISFFRTIFYMPSVIGGVATIMMWIWVFNPEYGLLNDLLRGIAGIIAKVGVSAARTWEPPKWLLSQEWAIPSLIIMSVWGTGASMLIFLAALQNVPDSLYEAADLDGAGKVSKFIHITVPQISPALFFNLVMGIIGSFQVFTEAFLMTAGGPNKATLFYVLYLYNKAFQDFEIGYASALAWILFIIIMAFTLLIIRSSKMWVYYAGE
ncbi:MAG TPA: sugar ABC transporter permease [Candidatus Brocadiia bacterium]|nr:sugar ABC transporter permease [Candidatus Brocadiia bacterium]